MANPEDIERLRLITSEDQADSKYTDAKLGEYIDTEKSVEAASSKVWAEKMAQYADLVDISEAGSSRKNSDLFKHAQEMRDYWDGKAPVDEDDTLPIGSFSTTRAIVRP